MIASRRKNAIFEARELLEQRPLYLDTETTGLGAKDVVMEIGIIDDEGNVLVDSLIRQSKTIDPAAGRMHGITSAMLTQAPTWESTWP
jgi:DNA polymerase-3 subunit epsilon